MSADNLRVDTDELLARAAVFDGSGQDSRMVSAADAPHVETHIEAFGEIKGMLHDMYRAVHDAKQQAWDDLGSAEGEHADKLRTNVHGYDQTDDTNANDLQHVDDMTGGIVPGSSFSGGGAGQVRPAIPGLHETPHPFTPGTRPIEGFQGGTQEGPTFVDGRSEAGQTRPSMPGLAETPQSVQGAPAQVRPAD
ncbi:type VII secretion target [Mycobacteroides abscessus]|uniref:type VII secretion target n=1 Tax=Mycobacteroides abscessus TaxID=36809 RepID=UPI0009A69BB3|nr:type VII secretion target [Mycobacteroides abscessus]